MAARRTRSPERYWHWRSLGRGVWSETCAFLLTSERSDLALSNVHSVWAYCVNVASESLFILCGYGQGTSSAFDSHVDYPGLHTCTYLDIKILLYIINGRAHAKYPSDKTAVLKKAPTQTMSTAKAKRDWIPEFLTLFCLLPIIANAAVSTFNLCSRSRAPG